MDRSTIRRLAAATAAAIATTVAFGLVAASSTAGAGEHRSSLAEVRRATAAYHDVEAALADGFVPGGECAEHPELGGMGIHYIHPARLADTAIDPAAPEVLMYEPRADGSLRLVGVEWFAADPDQDLGTDDGRPSVLGVPFDGPMPGHEGDMPIHFDLHAWIWKHNPAGMFSAWNPAVTCDAGSEET